MMEGEVTGQRKGIPRSNFLTRAAVPYTTVYRQRVDYYYHFTVYRQRVYCHTVDHESQSKFIKVVTTKKQRPSDWSPRNRSVFNTIYIYIYMSGAGYKFTCCLACIKISLRVQQSFVTGGDTYIRIKTQSYLISPTPRAGSEFHPQRSARPPEHHQSQTHSIPRHCHNLPLFTTIGKTSSLAQV